MKKVLVVFFLLFGFITIQAQQTGVLKVVISNIESQEGHIMFALGDSEESFKGEPIKTAIVEVKGETVTIEIEDIPFGTYAFKIYHDENDNEKLDTNMIGIPKEDYAFSNNASGKFGPAGWEDAKFEFTKDGQTEKVSL